MSVSDRVTVWIGGLEKWIDERPRPLLLSPLRLICSLGILFLLLLSNLAAIARWPFSAAMRTLRSGPGVDDGRPIHVGREELEQLCGSRTLVLVDFWAEWCGPCLLLNGVLKEFAEQQAGKLVVAKVDTTLHPGLAKAHRIDALPTLVLFRTGTEVARHVGPLSLGQLQQLVSEHSSED